MVCLAMALGVIAFKDVGATETTVPEQKLVTAIEKSISISGQILVDNTTESRRQELIASLTAVTKESDEYLQEELSEVGIDLEAFKKQSYDQVTIDPDLAALLKFVELVRQANDWGSSLAQSNTVIESDFELLIKKLGGLRQWVSQRHNHSDSSYIGLSKSDVTAIGILVFLIVAIVFESLLIVLPLIQDFTAELQNYILNEADLESKNKELILAYSEQEHLARKIKAQSFHLEEHLKTATHLAQQLDKSKRELHETQISARIGGVKLDLLNNTALVSPEAALLLGINLPDEHFTILDFLSLFEKQTSRGLLEVLSDEQYKIGAFTTWLMRSNGEENLHIKAEVEPASHTVRITLHELTQERNATQAMIKAKKAAEEVMKNKAHFLSTMSHEIRTPLNTITGFIELLFQENPRKDQLNYLDALRLSARHLLELLNDVLDLSKIEAGRIVFKQEQILTTEFAQQLYRIYEPQAVNKGLKFSIELDDTYKSAFISDRLRLNQIIANLINNAIKFTKRGFIKVRLRFIELGGVQCLQIEVEDSGIGIPVSDLQNLFSAYHQAENNNQPYQGTGLGLSICKHLVELQGGQIMVSSIVNRGTCFSFNLPVKLDQVDDSVNWREFNLSLGSGGLKRISETKPASMNILPSLEGLTVLLAEDDQTSQKLFSLFMKKWDVNLTIASNGKEVLEKLERLSNDQGSLPDVILLDLEMPVMSGFEAAKILKNHPEFQGIPVVALSAHTEVEVIEGRKDLGLSDYLVKPVDPALLHDTLATYLSAQKSLKQAL